MGHYDYYKTNFTNRCRRIVCFFMGHVVKYGERVLVGDASYPLGPDWCDRCQLNEYDTDLTVVGILRSKR